MRRTGPAEVEGETTSEITGPSKCLCAHSQIDNIHHPLPSEQDGEGELMDHGSATIAPAPQHMQALQKANEVRLARAELKRHVADGAVSVREVILQCPWEAASMPVVELLLSQRRWGVTRCSKFLAQHGMPEAKSIGAMTERQRLALAAAMSSN